jgi:hypothetical protein
VNEKKLAELEPSQSIVRLCQWEDVEAELDEMWSFVNSKKEDGYGMLLTMTRVKY